MLAVLSTHPIQYQIPLWQALARTETLPFEVWYLTDHGTRLSYDPQFDRTFAWDLDTLAGYPYRFVPANKRPDVGRFTELRLGRPLRELCRGHRVTALWVQGWQVAAYWQAVWQAHAAGIPIWLRGESNDLAPSPPVWKRFGKRLLLNQFFSRVEKFLYIGQANRRLYEEFGVTEGQLHPAPYGVDNERFARQAEALRPERTSIRRGWNIPDDAFCVLFAVKFIPKKRPFDLIAAARDPQLVKGRPVHLLFVGSGELGGELRRDCRVAFDADETPASERDGGSVCVEAPAASFVGFLNQTEISKAYVAADCLVLPSDQRETWGLVVNEAMASGLPCAASDACGCSEDLIAPLNAALRFPLGDTGALAGALSMLMTRPLDPSEVRSHVAKFRLSVTVETVKNLYGAQRGLNTFRTP